jgi:uncharacterized protein (DUF2164 family)
MKVIFLDNDGVICLANNWGSRVKKRNSWSDLTPSMSSKEMPVEYRFDNFDEKAIKVLNEILKETGAEIVVSSDWRLHANLEELGEYYLSQGIIKAPIAVTSRTEDIDPGAWNLLRYRADLELERSIEILDWLDKHPEVTNWVAVDDLNMSVKYLSNNFTHKDSLDKKPGLKNFVNTSRSNEGIKQSGIKEKIIKYLI